MPADLSGRDLCASAFSVALRDQCSIDPSIAASDLPLNGSRRERRGAERAETKMLISICLRSLYLCGLCVKKECGASPHPTFTLSFG